MIAFDFILDWLNKYQNHFRSKRSAKNRIIFESKSSRNSKISKISYFCQKCHFLMKDFDFIIQQRIWRRAASPFLVKCSSSFPFDKQQDKQLDIQWSLLQVSILRHGHTCHRFVPWALAVFRLAVSLKYLRNSKVL